MAHAPAVLQSAKLPHTCGVQDAGVSVGVGDGGTVGVIVGVGVNVGASPTPQLFEQLKGGGP